MEELKAQLSPRDFSFYPYGTLHNVRHLERLLTGENRDLARLIASKRVLDIGAADGDLAFFLESHGAQVDVVDYGPTNYNGTRGVRLLAETLGSSVRVHEVDLDSQFRLPDERYSLAVFLGILYHLKNPYYALEALSSRAEWCLLSTRVARVTPDGACILRGQPLAYLVGEDELNHDSTNFWIFSEFGLRRLLERTGWDVLDLITVGNQEDSDPARPDKDERAFCLARSRRQQHQSTG